MGIGKKDGLDVDGEVDLYTIDLRAQARPMKGFELFALVDPDGIELKGRGEQDLDGACVYPVMETFEGYGYGARGLHMSRVL